MDEVIEQVDKPVEAAPVETPQAEKPAMDEANIKKQARYFAQHPEAAKVFLENYDQLSGGKLNEKVTQLEQAFYTSEAMRKYGLDDDVADLIQAPTADAIFARAEKLAALKAAAKPIEEKPASEPEIVFPQQQVTYKNEMEAMYAKLARFKG